MTDQIDDALHAYVEQTPDGDYRWWVQRGCDWDGRRLRVSGTTRWLLVARWRAHRALLDCRGHDARLANPRRQEIR